MPHSPVFSSRTPPDLKWLLNERAAVAGEVNKAIARSQTLTAKMATLQRQMDKLDLTAQAVHRTRDARQGTLGALDAAIGLAYREVRPDAAGVVNAWAGRYGKRGVLKQFVVQALQDAAPGAVNIRDLMARIIAHFGILVLVPADRRSLKSSVSNIIVQLFQHGRVEPLHSRAGGSSPGLWRWKAPTTLSDLAAKAKALSNAAAANENLGHPAGCAGASPADANTA